MLGATETCHDIKNKTLDIRRNLVVLAHRCRKYGRNSVNAISEELYDNAYQKAIKMASVIPALSKDSDGAADDQPLFGVPISLKDCISLQGTYATAGMATRLERLSETYQVIVSVSTFRTIQCRVSSSWRYSLFLCSFFCRFFFRREFILLFHKFGFFLFIDEFFGK